MHQKKIWSTIVLIAILALSIQGKSQAAPLAQTEGPVAIVQLSQHEVVWVPQVSAGGFLLSIGLPGGQVIQQQFPAEGVLAFRCQDLEGGHCPDGGYSYELKVVPLISAETRARLDAARQDGTEERVIRELQQAGDLPAETLTQSGSFAVSSGAIQLDPQEELTAQSQEDLEVGSMADQVIPEDLIVQGSGCFGFDCLDGEGFGFDTLMLKENNLQIYFNDTSVGAFPSNDWRIFVNDRASGGANYFAVEDSTAVRVPFKIAAGAKADALVLSANGMLGVGTSTPAKTVHLLNSDTPVVRLDQDSLSGYMPQIWDVAGNETNFFIRDVTSGSLLPFRIRPGAPTSSIDISATGNVGIGTASPDAKLEVAGSALIQEDLSTIGATVLHSTLAVAGETQLNGGLAVVGDTQLTGKLNLDGTAMIDGGLVVQGETLLEGDLQVNGYVTELSDRDAKQGFAAVSGADVLERLENVPVLTWTYKSDDTVQHMGPVAQDFYAAFGLGSDEKHIAPLDVNGVTLAAVQELDRRVKEKDTQIQDLEARLSALEAGQPGGATAQLTPFLFGLLGLALGAALAKRWGR